MNLKFDLNKKKIIMSNSSFLSDYQKNINVNENSANSNNNEFILGKKIIEIIIHRKFNKKYSQMPLQYNLNIIDNILYNCKTHIISLFKDHLLMDDNSDFLKRYYTLYESFVRLQKFFEFYNLYSKLFPNYTSFPEGKYFYKNIQQKQRVINTIEKIELENKNNKKKLNKSYEEKKEDKVFSTNVIDSLLNATNDEGMEMLFNINKEHINNDDSIFFKEVNNIIDEIDKYKIKNENNDSRNYLFQKKQINHILKINNNKYIIKIKNVHCNNINNINNINNNINNSKKHSKINTISKYLNQTNGSKIISNKENYNILNLYTKNNTKINFKNRPTPKRNFPKLILMDKLENNYSNIHQKYFQTKKNISQKLSTSFRSKKEKSYSKNNKSLYMRRQNSILDNTYLFNKNFFNGLTFMNNKKNKELKNIKREILKIDLSKSRMSSRNNPLNFSLGKINNVNKNNITEHSSFILNSYRNISRTNILTNNNGSFHNKVYTLFNNNNNFNKINSNSRNKSFKNMSKNKISTSTNKNSKDSKNNKFSKKKIKYIKRNSSKIESLINNGNSILSCNISRENSNLKVKFKQLNSKLYFSSLTTRHESNKNISKKKLIKEDNFINNNKENKVDSNINKGNILNKKYSFKNVNNSKIIKKNRTILKMKLEDKKDLHKPKIKNIKINNFSKLFNVFIKHSHKVGGDSKPKTERNGLKLKI